MAKRRTLRRQRDNALRELAEWKERANAIRMHGAFQCQRYNSDVAVLKACHEFHSEELKCDFIDEKRITRLLLHDMVNEGLFDEAVTSRACPLAFSKMGFEIEIRVLKKQ